MTHNEALRMLDMVVQICLATRGGAEPPAIVEEGECHLVGSGASGAWAGREGQLAAWQDGAWIFLAPRCGWQAYVADEDVLVVHDGDNFRPAHTMVGGDVATLGINQSADLANRLSVASAASLFNHAGSDHRLKINKAGTADTASTLFQSGFQGHAEIGLAGRNDFVVKVSADGIDWVEALSVDAQTGSVAMPATALGEDMLVNSGFSVNQRGFSGGLLAAGKFGFDRWKSGSAGASLTAAAGVVTLSSGSIVQTVERGIWPEGDTATMTVFVADLAGGSLEVTCGTASATITPGAGLSAVTVAPGMAPNLAVSLRPIGPPVTFTRVGLLAGARRFSPRQRTLASEVELCRRYYTKGYDSGVAPADGAGGPGYNLGICYTAGTIASQRVVLAPLMRAVPSISFFAPNTGNSVISARWQAYGPGIAYGNAASMSLAEVSSGGFTTNIAFTGALAGSAYLLCGGWSAQAEL
ncbi:DUF2793 domain-containing protein [Aureimonas sp. SA4125]|uniref:DUF2793 domain-containing protein n=1 Tax=Aureimonas sp. SA4125 TaxID=2826993 RepID=UPI001CC80BF6|nr:DUF2793 domain-containing protein [Aureimonas sp. SA4125]